jgi:hypothetical protein
LSQKSASNLCLPLKGPLLLFLKIFSPKIVAKILAFSVETTVSFCKNLIITLAFEENANFFRRKFAKIGEKCDHNIGPMATREETFIFQHFDKYLKLAGESEYIPQRRKLCKFLKAFTGEEKTASVCALKSG